jgi:hypothetical protein
VLALKEMSLSLSADDVAKFDLMVQVAAGSARLLVREIRVGALVDRQWSAEATWPSPA